MNILKINGINSGYGKKQVLFDVSLDLSKGETLLIIGSNGSGKSTLLKVVFGILKPWDSETKIFFNSIDITSLNPDKRVKKGMVYIPQKNELFEELTVIDNLEISGMHTLKRTELKSRIHMVTNHLPDLEKILRRKCSNLSGGERKQVSFGMALMNKPILLILDEPLAGISPSKVNDILFHIIEMKKMGISFLIVEHRVRDIMQIADRIVGLKLGKAVENETLTLNNTMEVML